MHFCCAAYLAGVPASVVKPRTVRDAYVLRSELRARADTMAFFPAEVLLELYALPGDARDVLAVVAVATQVLVIAAALLAVFAALAQRRWELGVLPALGATPGYLFAVVWLQVFLMVAAGALVGLLLGWIAALSLSAVVAAQTGLAPQPALGGAEMTLAAVLVGAGSVLALIPSVAVYRQPVSAVLRS